MQEASETLKQIQVWEAGESYLSYPQLEKMSELFKVPVAVFFFPESSHVPPISESFRTLPEYAVEHLPRRIVYLIRKANAFLINLSELMEGKNPSTRQIMRDLSFQTRVSLAIMAKRVREYVGISLQTQCAWKNVDEALKNWREVLQGVGVTVFKDQFREVGFSGFCLYDEEFPIIYVNNSTVKTRQLFTLFHELAHLLFHTNGIDGLSDDLVETLSGDTKSIEIGCNRFAAEFLLPDEIFNAVIDRKHVSETIAKDLAAQFHVSREFIYRKLLERGLISQNTYQTASKKWLMQRVTLTGPVVLCLFSDSFWYDGVGVQNR